MAYKVFVTPAYFDTMGIRLLTGRLFTNRDLPRSPAIAVVSESFARKAWPGQSVVGRQISESEHPTAADWITIVGVVNDVKQSGPTDDQPIALYRPYLQATSAVVAGQPSLVSRTSFVIRAASDPYAEAAILRDAVRRADKDLPVQALISMDDLMRQAVASPRFHAFLLAGFACLGLGLTVVGLYGVLAYSVSRRTREFGVRTALGATRGRLIFDVVRQSAIMTGIGIGCGVGGTLLLTKTLRSFLFEVTPADPAVLAAVSMLLVIVAVLAALAPARHASRVDPAVALRAE
jgi:putative ABC transport system permease protein